MKNYLKGLIAGWIGCLSGTVVLLVVGVWPYGVPIWLVTFSIGVSVQLFISSKPDKKSLADNKSEVEKK